MTGTRARLAELLPQRLANLFRMMRAFGLDAAAAEDVVQETCCLALERAAQYRGDGPLFAWVSRIAYRQATRRGPRPDTLPDQELPDTDVPAPGAALLARESAARLQAAFDALPRWERTALLLQAIEGWSGDAIARVLDRPAATVYSDLSRARQRMRTWLGEDA